MGLEPKTCYTADNGVTIYEEDGPTILAALAEHQGTSTKEPRSWDQITPVAHTALLQMAAESPRWAPEGVLDDYRIEEFLETYPDIFEPMDTPQD